MRKLEKKLIVGIMALVTVLLIQQVNAEKHSEQYTTVTSACIQQGDAGIQDLIEQGVLDDKYANMTCEKVLQDLKS